MTNMQQPSWSLPEACNLQMAVTQSSIAASTTVAQNSHSNVNVKMAQHVVDAFCCTACAIGYHCRLLLCAQSPRLAQLIEAQVAANNQAQIPDAECKWTLHLPDVYPDVLALMLEYMYCSLSSIPVEAAPLLFKAADR